MGPMGVTRRVATALAAGLLAGVTRPTAARDARQGPRPTPLPPEVTSALATAQVSAEALAVLVEEVGTGATRMAWQSRRLVNPASLAKLVTTYAALDLLGPAHVWRTPVWLTGPVRDGTLDGSIVLRGSGDPKFTHERVWQFLRRLRQAGVQDITGDIVLDRSLFADSERAPAAFDNRPYRAYNVQPDALLFAHKAWTLSATPDPGAGVARLRVEPAVDGVAAEAAVPLSAAPCGEWRAGVVASVGASGRLEFSGSYPLACGPREALLADPQPESYAARLLRTTWAELGGRLQGTVRDGAAPIAQAPNFELSSPTLAEVVRDINKFSNNVMAEQLYLTLAAERRPGAPATPARAREVVLEWLRQRTGELADGVVFDNGSGLSRSTRMSPELLARLLQQAWAGSVMPELMASLPVNGLDGTLRRSRATAGRSHLKTGSLDDVAAMAGYALGDSGRRYVVVAIVHHRDAPAARPALDALLQWVLRDSGPRRRDPS